METRSKGLVWNWAQEKMRTRSVWFGTRILAEAHLFAVDLDVSHIVLEHSGHIDLWELVFTEDDQQAGLPTRSVSHYHQLLPDCSHL